MSGPNTMHPQGGAAPAPKKTSPWVYVLIGCGGLIIIVTLAMVGLGYFAFNKAKEAGIDPELIRKNPGLAAAKVIAAADPDIEVVDVEEDTGRITFRDKKTGKTVTMDLEDVKQGRIVFESDEGETLSMETTGEGGEGGLRMQTKEGSYAVGTGATSNLPDWLPVYPGGESEGVIATDTSEGKGGSTTIETPDSVEQVMEFYKKALEDAGLTTSTVQQGGATAGGMVTGNSQNGKRTATVILTPGDSGTTAIVSFSEKN